MSILEIMILLLIGLAAGILSGMFGVGGGILIVPALVVFIGMTQHAAQGNKYRCNTFTDWYSCCI